MEADEAEKEGVEGWEGQLAVVEVAEQLLQSDGLTGQAVHHLGAFSLQPFPSFPF